MSDARGGQPLAGWYPTPDRTGERYWDGRQWTDMYRPPSTRTHPGSGPFAGLPAPGEVAAPYTQGSVPPGYLPYHSYPATAYTTAPNHGPAIASMVLGIVSFIVSILGIVTAIIGLVLGLTSLSHCQPRGPKRGRGMAIAGIACSATALLLWAVILVVVGGFLFSVD